MTINWLNFKNETCVALRRLTKYATCSNLYFFEHTLRVGSACKAVMAATFEETPASGYMAPTQSMTSFFKPVKIIQWKRLMLWNVMHNDAKLTWGRRY